MSLEARKWLSASLVGQLLGQHDHNWSVLQGVVVVTSVVNVQWQLMVLS